MDMQLQNELIYMPAVKKVCGPKIIVKKDVNIKDGGLMAVIIVQW